MSNILEVSQQQAIQALIVRNWSIRRIARTLSVNRRTVQRYASATAPKCTSKVITGSDAADTPKCTTEVIAGTDGAEAPKCTTPSQVITGSRSLCGAFREVILPMLELGLSAQRIYQDLVAGHGFGGSYPPVSRYVARLKAQEPERVWRIECAPGEELQVDFGLGAPLVEAGGKTRRTWLFRAVFSHSRKGYSEVVLRQDTETFLRVIENAVRYFGGVPRLLNFDNLKAAVVKADWYDPALNPKLADFCRHYGMTPMPCRAYTPQHKGKVERGVGYAKNNALKGRQFASLAEAEVEAVEGARFAEVGALEPAGAGAAFAHGQFVLEEEFEELVVGEAVGGGFEEAGFEGFSEASATELAGVGFEGGDLAHDALEVGGRSVRETGVMAGAVDGPAMVAVGGGAIASDGIGGPGSGWKRWSPPGVWCRMKSV